MVNEFEIKNRSVTSEDVSTTVTWLQLTTETFP